MSSDNARKAQEVQHAMIKALEEAGYGNCEVRTESASDGDGFTAAVEVTSPGARQLLGTSGTGNGFKGGSDDDGD